MYELLLAEAVVPHSDVTITSGGDKIEGGRLPTKISQFYRDDDYIRIREHGIGE